MKENAKKKRNIWKMGSTILFLLYIGTLLKITVFRRNFGRLGLFPKRKINLKLFEEYARYDTWNFIYFFVGNIIWFVPLGFFLPVLFERIADRQKSNAFPGNKFRLCDRLFVKRGWIGKFLIVVLCGGMFSFMIEFLQYMFGTGVSDIDDLILNTTGAAVGFGLYFVFVTLCRGTRKDLKRSE